MLANVALGRIDVAVDATLHDVLIRWKVRRTSAGTKRRSISGQSTTVATVERSVAAPTGASGGDGPAVTEWFVNRPQGLEHGFTLAWPPGERGAGEPLRLVLELGGELRGREVDAGQAVELVDAAGAGCCATTTCW